MSDSARELVAAQKQLEETEGPERRAQPCWFLTKLASNGTVVIRFVGHCPTSEIPLFFSAITEMMPAQNANVIFDLRELLAHNPDTKDYAKRWLQENKGRLAQVTVVVPKAATILKMATAVVSLASGVKVRLRDDLDTGMPVTRL